MIILYQFPRINKFPNYSPFCLKIETFLRMMGLPYENCFVRNPAKGPKGKLPYINISGQTIADSGLIIDALKESYGNALDENLNDQQQAEAHLLEICFSEFIYWIMLYFRWQDEAGWQHLKPLYFKRLPGITKHYLPYLYRRKMLKSLYMQGMGRHSKDEIIQMAEKTMQTLATVLGDKPYFLGHEISTIDATAFGFLANIFWYPVANDLKIVAEKQQNLREFCDRMWHRFYFEMDQPFAII